MNPKLRRFAAWLLLLAMALASAAPSFASRASPEDLALLGICSEAAHEAVSGASSQGRDPGQLGSNFHHCSLCAPAAHAALPPALPILFAAPAEPAAFQLPDLATPSRPAYAGLTWRPRGPPART